MLPPWLERLSHEERRRVLETHIGKRQLPLPSNVEAQQLAEEIQRRGLMIYDKFEDFVWRHKPDLLNHEYMRRQINVAQRVLDGVIKRLLVFLPTQYGKSEIWSRLLPAYFLRSHPSRRVILASFGADLAWNLSSDARDIYVADGGKFREGSVRGQMKNWKTPRIGGESGGMWATGIGSSLLGQGFNLGIVDDPVHPEQAIRSAYQKRFQRWWTGQLLRGARPAAKGGSAIIFVMQRLDVADPAAWLLDRELTGAAEGWHVLCYDEVHSSEPYGGWSDSKKIPEKQGFPITCTIEPDFRKVGEVLAPKFRTEAEVKHIQATTGAATVSAQRQQRPMRPTGDFWQETWFKGRTYKTLPPDAHNGGWDWDTAYTKDEENSATAGILSYRGAAAPGQPDHFPIYIHDLQLQYLEFPELVKLLKDLINAPHYVEKKASGKSVVQTLLTYGIVAQEVGVAGDKLARASAVQYAPSTGRVYIHELIYEKLLVDHQGLMRITAEALVQGSEGLDLNDAFVQALFRHLGIGAPRKKKARVG